jgi:hypothetical protein
MATITSPTTAAIPERSAPPESNNLMNRLSIHRPMLLGINMRRVAVAIALSVGALALSLPVHASGTLTRTFVSSAGNDSNPCTIAAPCASFAAAYAAAAPNGIVAALDPGKYGPLTITGPVTIDGNGWAAITAPSNGAAISISAGASDAVILRGLTIDGAGVGSGGILFNTGGSLTVAGCVVRGNSSNGLAVFSNGPTPVTLTVEDSYFINTGTSGAYLAGFGSGALTASFARTEFTGNGIDGLELEGAGGTGAISVTVTDSVAANNFNAGFEVDSDTGKSVSNLSLTQVQTMGNGTGIAASGNNATLWLANSTVAGNTSGFQATGGGFINSYGDNYFAHNGSNLGSLGTATKQ